MATVFYDGLEGVAFAETSICHIDGTAGKLIYRGYSIEDLAENATFEEVAYLLWKGSLPKRSELEALNKELLAERAVEPQVMDLVSALPVTMAPMDALRTLVSYLAAFETELEDHSPEANFRKAIRLTAKFPTLIAAFHRHQQGLKPLEPLQEGGHAENFLFMLHGTRPDAFVARTLDVILLLHAEHGMNASTVSARVAAATLTDIYSSVVSAIGTLKGPRHGGANAIVVLMLQEIGEPDQTPSYVRSVLDGRHIVPSGEPKRIPGFGHRVYKIWDPRAKVLRTMCYTLGERAGNPRWVQIAERVEKTMEEAGLFEKKVYPNVDFFAGTAYHTMGVDLPLFTPLFALARISGWTAHILEQQTGGRLIRPADKYVGPMDLKYVPIDRR